MGKRSLLAAIVCVVFVAVVLVLVWERRAKREPINVPVSIAAQLSGEKIDSLDPLVTALLHEKSKNDPEHKSPFFAALIALARKHSLGTKEYWLEECAVPDEGYAVQIGTGSDRHVVAILRGDSHCIPGYDAQYLLLLDRDGRLLDWLACVVNNRLTRMFLNHMVDFRTEVPEANQADGAQLVVRFIPENSESISGNWRHSITHAGRTTYWSWSQDELDAIRSAEWDSKGLCRIAIRDSRFSVLFPSH